MTTRLRILLALAGLWLLPLGGAFAQAAPAPATPSTSPAVAVPASNAAPLVNLQLGGGTDRQNVSAAIQIVFLMTLLTLAPSILMLMTSFTRVVIVLGFVRNALGVQGAPSNQILIGISLFLTFFIMAPVWREIQTQSIEPYMSEKIDSRQALERATAPVKQFMLRQARPSEVDFFLGLTGKGPTTLQDVPLEIVLPAFVVSELRTAFQMGFLIFVPFLVIDFLVSSTLMSMGMMMMPPTVVSMPFKLLLFVLVDGWHLVIRSLVQSFGI
jgi:flagellar biosynthetic protein FliP